MLLHTRQACIRHGRHGLPDCIAQLGLSAYSLQAWQGLQKCPAILLPLYNCCQPLVFLPRSLLRLTGDRMTVSCRDPTRGSSSGGTDGDLVDHGLLLDVLRRLLHDVQQAPDVACPAVQQRRRLLPRCKAHKSGRPVDARRQRSRHHHVRQVLLGLHITHALSLNPRKKCTTVSKRSFSVFT